MDRRQLTDAQKVLLGKKIEPDIAALARQRQPSALRQGNQDHSPFSYLRWVASSTDDRFYPGGYCFPHPVCILYDVLLSI